MDETTTVSYQDQGRATTGADLHSSVTVTEYADPPKPRVVGSPLPGGGGYSVPPQTPSPFAPPASSYAELRRLSAAPPPPPPPRRALASPSPSAAASGLQRAVNALRVAIPFVQKLLPLLDGNVGTTVSNILNPRPPAPPPPPPAPVVDLAPIQEGLATLQSQHRELREHFIEQHSSLKRVEDHLEMVREATDRNTLEQQELLEDLKSVGSKVNVVAVIAVGLLGISVLLNLLLYMHIQRVLP